MEKITTSLLKLSAKIKKSTGVVDFCSILASAKSVLIIMPDKLDHFGVARNFLTEFKNDFKDAEIVFLTRDNYHSLLDITQPHGIIFVTREDISQWGLPKKKLQSKILATKFDIVIDLNIDFHLLSTYLCQITHAPLKICLDDQDREPFYNFSFRINSQKNSSEKYQGLLKYIGTCAQTSSK